MEPNGMYLLACKTISDLARIELERAGIRIISTDDIAGLEDGMEIVVITLDGPHDQVMRVWDIPREIQLHSRAVRLNYNWDRVGNGWRLTLLDEGAPVDPPVTVPHPDYQDLGELDEHPF